MRKIKKMAMSILGVVLALVMIVGVMPVMNTITALAYSNNPYSDFVCTTNAVTFNGKPWYIIADNSSSATEGTVTLLAADTSFGVREYDSKQRNDYSVSDIKSYLDAQTESGGDFASVADVIVTNEVAGGKLYLLSYDEARKIQRSKTGAEEVLKVVSEVEEGNWWLRTTGLTIGAAYVHGTIGMPNDNGAYVWKKYVVRPALQLDLSKVTFDSDTKTFSVSDNESIGICMQDEKLMKEGSVWNTGKYGNWNNCLSLTAGNYKLTSDIQTTATIVVQGEVSLDLNGYSIGNTSTGYVLYVTADSVLTINDSNGAGKTNYYYINDKGLGVVVADKTDSNYQSADKKGSFTGGYITGGKNSGVYNYKGTFNMKGGTIIGNEGKDGGGVTNCGTFDFENGSIIGNCSTQNGGGGIRNGEYNTPGTLTLKENAKILNNQGLYEGGGIFNDLDSTVTVDGAVIKDNQAEHGAGIANYGTALFKKGVIEGNTATTSGGGVCVGEGTFTMTGGRISHNKAVGNSSDASGGGVCISRGKFILSGGSIIDNNAKSFAGGVYYSGGSFELSGDPVITGNTTNNRQNDESIKTIGNVCISWLTGSYFITITGELKNTIPIGIVIEKNALETAGEFTNTVEDNLIYNDDSKFVGEGTCFVEKSTDSSQLKMTRGRTLIYHANGATGTAPTAEGSPYNGDVEITVPGAGDLQKPGFVFGGWNTRTDGTGTNYAEGDTLTLTTSTILYAKWTLSLTDAQKPKGKTGLVYDDGHELTLVTAPTEEVTGFTVKYSIDDGTTWTTEVPTCTDAGDYTVKVKYVNETTQEEFGGDDILVSVAKKAQGKPTETFTTIKATDETSTDGKISGFDADKSYQYSSDNGTNWTNLPANSTNTNVKAGTYQIRYAGDDNKEPGEAVSVTVGVKGTQTAPDASSFQVTKTSTPTSEDGVIKGVTEAMEYSTDDGSTWTKVANEASAIEGLKAGDVKIRYAKTDDYKESDAVTVKVGTKEDQSAPASTLFTPTKASNTSASDGTISGVTDAMEYKESGDTEWKKVPTGATAIEGLKVGVTATKASSSTSQDGTISGVDDTMEYSTDDGDTWTKVPTSVTVIEGLNAGVVKIRYAGTDDKNPSEPVSVTVPAKANQEPPVTTGITVTKTTGDTSNDGEINGVDSTMEYSTDGGNTWTKVPADTTTLKDLKAGVVKLRYAGDDDKNPSAPVDVTVGTKGNHETLTQDKFKVTYTTTPTSNDGVISGVDDEMEYSTDGGNTWTKVEIGKITIDNLEKGDVLIRYYGDEDTNQGNTVTLTVGTKTNQTEPDTSTLKTTKTTSDTSQDGVITGVDDTMEYSTDGGNTWVSVPEGKTSIEGLKAGDVKIRYAKTDEKNESEAVTVSVGTKENQVAPKTSGISTTKASGDSAKDGTISGVDDTMEYSVDGGLTWKDVPSGVKVISGLGAGEVKIRYAGTDDKNASEAVTVTVEAKKVKNIETGVKKDEKAPDLKVANLTDEFAESTLSSEEKSMIEEALEQGKDVNVEVYVEISDISDSISEADKAKIKSEALDAGNIEFFDISLLKKISIDGQSQGTVSIHNIDTPLKLTIAIPNSFPAVASGYTRTYIVFRLHDGKVVKLQTTLNADGTITFETDKFSTYALGYIDVKTDGANTPAADTPTANVPTNNTNTSKTNIDTSKQGTKKSENNVVQTGDKMDFGFIVMMMIGSAVAAIYLELKRRKIK